MPTAPKLCYRSRSLSMDYLQPAKRVGASERCAKGVSLADASVCCVATLCFCASSLEIRLSGLRQSVANGDDPSRFLMRKNVPPTVVPNGSCNKMAR
jgi:hypothetical protein